MKKVILFLVANFKYIVIFGAVWKVYQIFDSVKPNFSGSENIADNDKLNTGTSRISIVEARSLAEQFSSALITERFSDSLAMVIPIFNKLKTQEDFNAVYNEFGKRQYSHTFGNEGDPLFSGNYDLLSILANEFDSSEQAELSYRYPHLRIF
tara:strand:+ start:4479 stop:4934 length:456 start_codon:yes stop_codon:yes gene_type:complete